MKADSRPSNALVRAVVFDAVRREWLACSSPLRVFETRRVEEVSGLLAEVEKAVEHVAERGDGMAVGWVSYEASPAFDNALTVKQPGGVPLLWFALFEKVEAVELPDAPDQVVARQWQSTADEAGHGEAVQIIRDYIRAGDTYQVNFTYRLRAGFDGDPWRAFLRLIAAQHDTYGAFIDTGTHVVCSASPELYFRLDGERIESKPMKGTATRGLTLEDDREQARALRASDKERAENVMIVDMVRHDLGRIADVGSVKVPALFTVEKYPTIWTMTSTVEARTHSGLGEIFAKTFPPASITGAPKRRTMEIIDELENSPRGIYTGAVGFIAPNRVAQFNVAIRTLVVDRAQRTAEYGVGSGIVWDSEAGREWKECQAKTRILSSSITPFDLLETLKWTPGEGYALLDRHVNRLIDSAEYFACPVSAGDIRAALERASQGFSNGAQRVRLLVDRKGGIRIEHKPLDTAIKRPLRIALAAQPVNSNDRFLYHKTTHREVYDAARAMRPGYDDVVLHNERGEVCETTIANIVVELDGKLYTPPVACGLLPGTLRAELLERGELTERVITTKELLEGANFHLINSVRGRFDAELDRALRDDPVVYARLK
jgi:para-aminobenzoate synthetase/4-amino-4-deoxychorismate lyase